MRLCIEDAVLLNTDRAGMIISSAISDSTLRSLSSSSMSLSNDSLPASISMVLCSLRKPREEDAATRYTATSTAYSRRLPRENASSFTPKVLCTSGL